ncbi:MAG TPA: formyltransferase family protein [Candidatus Saccharimonadales bacterium]|jgi:phosphoribosylglycinamide formyltransferase-1|nr:formyltransferase family protein [Candidatus Saccharimonadales bacterium]
MTARHRPAIAIFASGSGTTFQATADAIHQGLVDFDIGLVITDREHAGVLQRVDEVNRLYGFIIKKYIINKKRYPGNPQGRGQTRDEAAATIAALEANRIDHLCLMGCLRIIAPQVIEAYGWQAAYAKKDPEHDGLYMARMTNTHPGILPATADTFGIQTQQKVLELGLEETAQSFHVVATGVDKGPLISENRVRVHPALLYPAALADTPEKLFARVQRIEKAHLPLDLDTFLKDQARWLARANAS